MSDTKDRSSQQQQQQQGGTGKRVSRDEFIAQALLDAIAARTKPWWEAHARCVNEYHPRTYSCMRAADNAYAAVHTLHNIMNVNCSKEFDRFLNLTKQLQPDIDRVQESDRRLWKCIDSRFNRFMNPVNIAAVNHDIDRIRHARQGIPYREPDH